MGLWIFRIQVDRRTVTLESGIVVTRGLQGPAEESTDLRVLRVQLKSGLLCISGLLEAQE